MQLPRPEHATLHELPEQPMAFVQDPAPEQVTVVLDALLTMAPWHDPLPVHSTAQLLPEHVIEFWQVPGVMQSTSQCSVAEQVIAPEQAVGRVHCTLQLEPAHWMSPHSPFVPPQRMSHLVAARQSTFLHEEGS
jgi:hypothetical protein